MIPYHNTAMLAGEDNLCILLSSHRTQHLTHNGCVLAGAVGLHAWRLSKGLIRKLHFKFYKHFDLTGNRTPVAWTEIQSANHYTTDL